MSLSSLPEREIAEGESGRAELVGGGRGLGGGLKVCHALVALFGTHSPATHTEDV